MSSQRSSLAEWAGSAIVMAKGSLKIVLAYSNVTPCLFSLPLAFSSSHSNWMLICHACNSLIVPAHATDLTRFRERQARDKW